MSNSEIEQKIKPLVDEINKINGVKTFASCEGNNGNQAYVAFTISDLKAFDELYKITCKLRINNYSTSIEHLNDYDFGYYFDRNIDFMEIF